MKILLYSLAIVILGLAVALRIAWFGQKQVLPKNQSIKLVATLKSEPRIYEASQVLEIGDARVYVDLYPRYKVGDRIKIEGEIDNQGRIYRARVEKLGEREVGGVLAVGKWMSQLRLKISQNIGQLLPSREATLVVGTVLGVDNIGREFRDQLIKTGTIHVVVVSGQNLMIVAGVFLSLIKYLGRRTSLILALSFSILYAFLTGFEPPVMRATLMVLASTLAIFWGREAWPLWSLVMAALLIIFVWPQAIFEISFQLTFAATLGIMTLGQYLAKILNFKFSILNLGTVTPHKKAHGIRDTLGTLFINNTAIAISAYLFTAPLILYYFGRVWPLAPLANILVVEAVFPVMILGFLIAGASLIFAPLAQVLAYFAYIPAFYFVKVVEISAKIPIEQMSLGKGSLVVVISFYILLFGLIWIWGRKRATK